MGNEKFLPRTRGNPNTVSQETKREAETEQQEEEPQEEEERARCEWDFDLTTVVSSNYMSPSATVCDTLGVVEFDPSGTFLVTGGIARKIRVYSLSSLLPDEGTSNNHGASFLDHSKTSECCLCTPAKLSSLRWKPGSGGRVIGSGDYDGVVMEYDVERLVSVFERDEHGGRRVWSIDYSHSDPVLGSSGSDDGSFQLWDPRCDGGNCVAKVYPSVGRRSPVCCVEFNPLGGPFLAVGCADRKAYGYDVRRITEPLFVFDGHQKAVTYVRFLDHHSMVTSGIDGCLKMWNTEDQRLMRTYRGHVNARRFVGLSVWRNGGLLGCGSESNQVFVYDKRWGEPIWVHGFQPVCVSQAREESGFVSSVCWRQVAEDQCTLVAGRSDGVLQVFEGKRSCRDKYLSLKLLLFLLIYFFSLQWIITDNFSRKRRRQTSGGRE